MQKGKKIIFIIAAATLLPAVLIIFLWLGNTGFNGPVHYINPNIPSGFLYQTRSDIIPENYLLVQNEPLHNGLIYEENGKFYCNSTGAEAEKIEYFRNSPGGGVVGGWSYRYAVICGDTYWIVDGADSFGEKIYGSFEK